MQKNKKTKLLMTLRTAQRLKIKVQSEIARSYYENLNLKSLIFFLKF